MLGDDQQVYFINEQYCEYQNCFNVKVVNVIAFEISFPIFPEVVEILIWFYYSLRPKI